VHILGESAEFTAKLMLALLVIYSYYNSVIGKIAGL
jgi:hypothetical protein